MNSYLNLIRLYYLVKEEQDELRKLNGKIKRVEDRVKVLNSAIQLIKDLCVEKGMNEEGLYPCKKCRGKPQFHQWVDGDNEAHRSIRCSKCDNFIDYDDESDGVDKWNDENEKVRLTNGSRSKEND